MPSVKLILIVIVLLLGWRAALTGRKSMGIVTGTAGKVATPEVRYLALGDSYTIGESIGAEECYPAQVSRLLGAEDRLDCGDPEIIAMTGWTTGNLLNALADAKPPYDVVSLLIGVNNQYQGRSQAEYREQFALLLQKSI